MKDITVIIPIHEYNENIKTILDLAINSVETQENKPKLMMVYSNKIEKEITENYSDKEIILLKNENKTDFQSQVNYAVENIDTEYFSILEYDDEYSTTFFKIANKYINELDKVDIFLPIMIEVNNENQVIKLTNESVWSKQFVGENGDMGHLNATALNNYTDFKISGGVIKKDSFIAVNGLKSNIKLAINYEFLLRMLNNGYSIFTIPKIGYKHISTREGSLFDVYGKTMNQDEKAFWFKTAKNESNFINDRVIDTSNLTEKK